MALILDGNGLIQGLSAGGLPDGSVNASSLASTLDLSSKTMTFGNVTASGITFPASVSASGNPNTLDDYEEGTWTPSVGGNATYINQLGHYTKIGNFVKLRFHLEINVLGTGSTTTITGIPFNPSNNGPSIVGGVVCYVANLANASLYLGVYCQSNGNIYFFRRDSDSTGATEQQPAVIGNLFNSYCEISYMI